MIKNLNLKQAIGLGILFAFLVNTFGPAPSAYAQEFYLPAPGQMVALSPAFTPAVLKGIQLDAKNPFRFHFFVDKGDGSLSQTELKNESSKLIKYFLASLTIPEKDLWVNLSPYEKDRIVPQEFGQTEMGRDLLAEDYMLKQITASLIYPEDKIGKEFWAKVYAQAQAKYGTTNIPINTFNKVWIVPDKAVVYENGGTAFVLENHLKVMLEQDYLSLAKHEGIQGTVPQVSQTNQLGSQIIRELVIPQLEHEVNYGKNFSQLRQVFYSLILATWYKKKIKDSILNKVYSNQNKISGVNVSVEDKDKIYQQYLKAFKKGAFNYIKEEPDLPTNQTIVKKYFSGGWIGVVPLVIEGLAQVTPAQLASYHQAQLTDELVVFKFDHAMSTAILENTYVREFRRFFPNVELRHVLEVTWEESVRDPNQPEPQMPEIRGKEDWQNKILTKEVNIWNYWQNQKDVRKAVIKLIIDIKENPNFSAYELGKHFSDIQRLTFLGARGDRPYVSWEMQKTNVGKPLLGRSFGEIKQFLEERYIGKLIAPDQYLSSLHLILPLLKQLVSPISPLSDHDFVELLFTFLRSLGRGYFVNGNYAWEMNIINGFLRLRFAYAIPHWYFDTRSYIEAKNVFSEMVLSNQAKAEDFSQRKERGSTIQEVVQAQWRQRAIRAQKNQHKVYSQSKIPEYIWAVEDRPIINLGIGKRTIANMVNSFVSNDFILASLADDSATLDIESVINHLERAAAPDESPWIQIFSTDNYDSFAALVALERLTSKQLGAVPGPALTALILGAFQRLPANVIRSRYLLAIIANIILNIGGNLDDMKFVVNNKPLLIKLFIKDYISSLKKNWSKENSKNLDFYLTLENSLSHVKGNNSEVNDAIHQMLQEAFVNKAQLSYQGIRVNQEGGIDLNPAQMSMQINKEGHDFKFEFDGTTVDVAQVTGATFTIEGMTSVTNLPAILGFAIPPKEESLVKA